MAVYVEDRPRNTVYTGILAISLIVLVGVSALLYFDLDALGKPPAGKLNVEVPGGSSATPAKTAAP